MTSQELIDICWQYQNSWDVQFSGMWYSMLDGRGDWKYTMHFHIDWARTRIEEREALNKQLKQTVG